jgi:tRNA(fMet)-specific endonuclease VapC
MNGRFRLDTNIVIGLLAAEPAVTRPLQAVEEVFLPSIVLGELNYGALKSKRTAQNLARVDALTAAAAVLPCDADTAREYGRIKNGLRAWGNRFQRTTSGSRLSPCNTGSYLPHGIRTSTK